jgi:L-serine/L-threonine ammonia-lyase
MISFPEFSFAATLMFLLFGRAVSFPRLIASSRNNVRLSRRMSASSSAKLAEGAEELFSRTPLVYSNPISKLVGKPVYCKMDALQSSGSFKDRGMAHLCASCAKEGAKKLISSSGGNAGLAVTTVGAQLGMSISVIVPETTKSVVIDKLRSLGAEVTVHGVNWNEADKLARELVGADPSAKYISPYDNPLLWTGHSTIVDEIVEDLDSVGAVVVSVGGGGLLAGVLEGFARNEVKAKVIAAETEGASSFGQAWEAGEVVTLTSIDSIATSLGATSVTPVVLERAKQHVGGFSSSICSDAEAVDACLKFCQDHRLLVEPANGAALAVAYSERLRDLYLKDVEGPIVLEVCGGSGISIDLLQSWKEEFGL